MYLCVCHSITEAELIGWCKEDSTTMFEEVEAVMKCTDGCCTCLPRIKEIIDEQRNKGTCSS